jgi:hypothetical protein
MGAPSSTILKGFELVQHFYGSMPILSGKAGATIAVGDVLEDASGLLTLADHDDTTTIVGVAKSAASSGGTVSYIPCWTGCIFAMTLDGDTNTGVVLADTQRLQQYGLGIDAGNGKPYINTDETTSITITVVDFIDAVGTAFGRVKGVFLPNKTVWGV